jgi:peptidoglycan/xylan/chitin deacetylase (PgdA/CDA1 family)
MAPRHKRMLIAMLITVLLTSCTTGDNSVWTQPRATGSLSAAGAVSDAAASGQGAGGPVKATSRPRPAASGSQRSGLYALSPSPQSSPSPSPTPTPSASPPAAPPSNAHGPAGSINTTGSDAVALTFDDGPGGNTGQVLDLLKQYGIHATFCIIGRVIADYSPDLIRRIVAEGHTLCNHTWTHDLNLRTRSEDQIRSELQRTSDAIHAIVPGAPIKYFRNPGGNFSPLTVSVAASMGMQSLDWNVDPSDWSRPGTQSIINNVLTHTHAGSIVLMHDGGGDRSQTVQALRTILPNLQSRFTLVPMPV